MDEPLFDLAAYGRRVRIALASENLSYRDAAPLVGVSPSSLHRLARARGIPDVETYLRVERWLSTVEARP